VFFQYIACSFQKDVNLGILKTNGLHVRKYCNGVYSSHYVSHRVWAVVCVLLVCRHIFLPVCATNVFYTSYVIEMKPDKSVA